MKLSTVVLTCLVLTCVYIYHNGNSKKKCRYIYEPRRYETDDELEKALDDMKEALKKLREEKEKNNEF